MSYGKDKRRGEASFGMARSSVHARRRATRAVRTLTAVGVTAAVVGTTYLTAALVPAAHVAASTGTPSDPSAGPSATPLPGPASAPAATGKVAVPHSLTATKKPHHAGGTVGAKAARTTTAVRTHGAVHPPATAAPTHVRTAPTTQAPTTKAPPPVTHAPQPKPVVTSGGS